jgi:Lrp/AsnC family leucine-responsive transcriptional regulator
MATRDLDQTDIRLLALLQRDNRRPLRDLAEALGVSAPTCLRRMRRLEQSGAIRAHAAQLDAQRVGFAVIAHIEVVLTAASGAEMSTFERRMSRCADVLQCWELAGEVDYLITVATRGMRELSEFTRKHLADDRSVRSYRTMIVLRQTKNAPLPLDEARR